MQNDFRGSCQNECKSLIAPNYARKRAPIHCSVHYRRGVGISVCCWPGTVKCVSVHYNTDTCWRHRSMCDFCVCVHVYSLRMAIDAYISCLHLQQAQRSADR